MLNYIYCDGLEQMQRELNCIATNEIKKKKKIRERETNEYEKRSFQASFVQAERIQQKANAIILDT